MYISAKIVFIKYEIYNARRNILRSKKSYQLDEQVDQILKKNKKYKYLNNKQPPTE